MIIATRRNNNSIPLTTPIENKKVIANVSNNLSTINTTTNYIKNYPLINKEIIIEIPKTKLQLSLEFFKRNILPIIVTIICIILCFIMLYEKRKQLQDIKNNNHTIEL